MGVSPKRAWPAKADTLDEHRPQAWSSEGDIRPMFALAHGLARRGHDVELARIGVALKPLPRRSLSAERLADRIRATTSNAGERQQARELAPQIRGENGVERAAYLIESLQGPSVE